MELEEWSSHPQGLTWILPSYASVQHQGYQALKSWSDFSVTDGWWGAEVGWNKDTLTLNSVLIPIQHWFSSFLKPSNHFSNETSCRNSTWEAEVKPSSSCWRRRGMLGARCDDWGTSGLMCLSPASPPALTLGGSRQNCLKVIHETGQKQCTQSFKPRKPPLTHRRTNVLIPVCFTPYKRSWLTAKGGIKLLHLTKGLFFAKIAMVKIFF